MCVCFFFLLLNCGVFDNLNDLFVCGWSSTNAQSFASFFSDIYINGWQMRDLLGLFSQSVLSVEWFNKNHVFCCCFFFSSLIFPSIDRSEGTSPFIACCIEVSRVLKWQHRCILIATCTLSWFWIAKISFLIPRRSI